MRIVQRDYTKHPLTRAEVEKLAEDGRRMAKAHREVIKKVMAAQRRPGKGGPRYARARHCAERVVVPVVTCDGRVW
jgi:hypothetical protein